LCNFALVICQAAWKTHLLDTANSTATTQLLSRCQVVAVVVVVPVVAATVTVSAWLAAGTLSQHHFSSPKKKSRKKTGTLSLCTVGHIGQLYVTIFNSAPLRVI